MVKEGCWRGFVDGGVMKVGREMASLIRAGEMIIRGVLGLRQPRAGRSESFEIWGFS